MEGIYAKTNQAPDLQYSYKNSFVFSVECKYRSQYSDEITIASDAQLKRYKEYAQKNREKVYVVLGIGGQPQLPESIYLLPLKEISKSKINLSYIEQFKKDTDKFWFNTKTYELI